jgi:hypothetical protein
VPPSLPERFALEVRLGRHDDIEAWLATDVALDRPVLVEWLGPDVGTDRRSQFVAAVTMAAGVEHVHLASVFDASLTEHGAYSVTEWAGGVTIGDRLRAGEAIPSADFLPNAAGLADALTELHAAGIVHGGISADTILFSAAHPAKLSGFGRGTPHSQMEDTRLLAEALTLGIVGGPTDLPPSQVAPDLPAEVDGALGRASSGQLDAKGLASALRAAPSPAAPRRRPPWSWRWVAVGAVLLAAALVLVVVGLALDAGSNSPFLFPAGPAPDVSPSSTAPPFSTVVPPGNDGQAISVIGDVYDPFGDGGERNADLALSTDGNESTGWRTERYFDPLQTIKPGVGATFSLQGTPASLELVASDGVRYEIKWAAEVPERFDSWEGVASGTILGGSARIQLPPREDGAWLLWLTDLPDQENGEYFYGYVYEVRFRL